MRISFFVWLLFIFICPTSLFAVAIPVTVAVAKEVVAHEKLRAVGTLEPLHTILVASQTNGRVAELNVSEGESVQQGQLLARINNPDAAATEAVSTANLSKLEIAYKTQKDITDRVKKLVELGTYPSIRLVTENQKLSSIQADMQAAQRNSSTTTHVQDLADIASPVSGVIQAQKVYLNTVVAIGTPLFVIAFGDELKAVLPFSQDERAKIKEGMPVELHIFDEARPVYFAKVSGVQPIINAANRSFNVFIKLKKPNDWYPGMSVIGLIALPSKKVIEVPQLALVLRNNIPYIFTLEKDNTVKQRAVQIQLTSEGVMWVLNGLKPGEKVVVQGANELNNGTKVVVE